MKISISSTVSRLGRGALLAGAALSLVTSSAAAATLEAHSGTVGPVKLTDTVASPGAKCSYIGGGTAGHTYLTGIRINGFSVEWPSGVASDHGTVQYLARVEHWNGTSWTVVASRSGGSVAATTGAWSALAAIRVPVNVTNKKYRGALKLTWVNPDNSVEGKGWWYINHHRQHDGTTAAACFFRYTNGA